ncbi:hypothetical protein AB0O01_19840 [Streptomyces sp. NPDC093252]|uniref:hypothetical protein n=1 Tax=Streptomyces sp. NPDC093252 TaxID=3154980 RepID=UPI00342C1D1A
MRGLTGAGSTRTRTPLQTAMAATAACAALALLVAACGAGGTGARDEGPANAEALTGGATTAPSAPESATPSPREAVRLVQEDPKVSPAVKRGLQPCVADEYPVDVSYGDLTGGTADDVVINVLTCGDAVGVGSYVYRDEGGDYKNVFLTEEPPVYAEIDRGDLVVTKQVYERGDPVSNPSGENVITYRWTAGEFAEKYRTHNDYGDTTGGELIPAPEIN